MVNVKAVNLHKTNKDMVNAAVIFGVKKEQKESYTRYRVTASVRDSTNSGVAARTRLQKINPQMWKKFCALRRYSKILCATGAKVMR